jgi:hypothetical protein
MKALSQIQAELSSPKGQFNQFGKYNYRSCEDILQAVKPLLTKYNCLLTLSDELVNIGDRYYIKATVIIRDLETKEFESVTAFAREAENKKGMDESQITGASSSYSRKYALAGLFCIDNEKDADVTNRHGKEPVKRTKKDVCAEKQTINKNDLPELLQECKHFQEAWQVWILLTEEQQADDEIIEWFGARKKEFMDEEVKKYG